MNPYQYGLIKSQHNGFYLDVEGARRDPDTAVCCWDRNAKDNQLWFYDAANSVIRSKMNDFVLEYSEAQKFCVLNPFNPENFHQKWRFQGGFIMNAMIPNMALCLPGQSKERGTRIISAGYTGQPDQLWSFENHEGFAPMPQNFSGQCYPGQGFQGQGYPGQGNPGQGYPNPYGQPGAGPPPTFPQYPGPPGPGQPGVQICPPHPSAAGGQQPFGAAGKEFIIKSQMDDKVLDVKGDDSKEGALVIMYKPHRKKNQLWYCDQQGFIRSSLNGFVFYAKDRGSSLRMVPFADDPKHKWRLEGNKIVNGEGSCLDIRGGRCNDGSELCAYEYKNKPNQHWKTEPY